ncbi:hypothetical protein GUJ93_ZPchr0004g39000 [Zizania palustris]|uniref:Uncharacterized protein n=1 Tax=Zizania palustris TaxID=103762 RepID=A0A8J5SKB4_ZIZPA|nr:hypothetical protein GUJ93_ZPchr0004g39000 [Zizania palustris]
MSMRDLTEEFVALEIPPLKEEWPASLRSSQDESTSTELSRRLGTSVRASDPAPIPSEDSTNTGSEVPANAAGAPEPGDGADSEEAPEEASEEANRETGIWPRPPSSSRGARSSVPLPCPFLEEGEDFASRVASVHDSYLRLREAQVIDELSLMDSIDLSRAIESAAGQVAALAQGSLLSLLSECRRHESSTSELSGRADAAKRLVREQAAEIEDLRCRATRVEALEAQIVEVDSLKARVAELEGFERGLLKRTSSRWRSTPFRPGQLRWRCFGPEPMRQTGSKEKSSRFMLRSLRWMNSRRQQLAPRPSKP